MTLGGGPLQAPLTAMRFWRSSAAPPDDLPVGSETPQFNEGEEDITSVEDHGIEFPGTSVMTTKEPMANACCSDAMLEARRQEEARSGGLMDGGEVMGTRSSSSNCSAVVAELQFFLGGRMKTESMFVMTFAHEINIAGKDLHTCVNRMPSSAEHALHSNE